MNSSLFKLKMLSWYYNYWGQTCTEKIVRATMMWPGLTQDVQRLCPTCQLSPMTSNISKSKPGYFPKKADSDPSVIVCVDLLGPL